MRASILISMTLAAAIGLAGCSTSDDEPVPGNDERLKKLRQQDSIALYWLGREYEGEPVFHVTSGGAIDYGELECTGEFPDEPTPCYHPYRVTQFPLCKRRNAGLEPVEGPPASTAFRRRDDKIEIHTGTTAVLIEADSFEDASAAAFKLRPIDEEEKVGRLPPSPPWPASCRKP